MPDEFIMDGAVIDSDIEPEVAEVLPDDGDEPLPTVRPIKKGDDDDAIDPADEEMDLDEDELEDAA